MEFIDLHAQRRRIAGELAEALREVVEGGQFVLGPQVAELEQRLAAWSGASRVVSCANGTDAIELVLSGLGVGPGDLVFCPSFTFVATAQAVPRVGAVPAFVDVDAATYTMDPASLRREAERHRGRRAARPRAVIAVDLFGQPANYPALREVCDEFGLLLISDSAQGLGCTLHGIQTCRWADAATTSFFPAKPLGGYGDGGAVLTCDEELAERVDSLRSYGRAIGAQRSGTAPGESMRVGMNSRLDTLQAAVLLVKLGIFDSEIAERQVRAQRYDEALRGVVRRVPTVIAGGRSVWAQYVIESDRRAELRAHLHARGVPARVYYDPPIHRHAFAAPYAPAPGTLPVTERASEHVLALPMHPYLDEDAQQRVVAAVLDFEAERTPRPDSRSIHTTPNAATSAPL